MPLVYSIGADEYHPLPRSDINTTMVFKRGSNSIIVNTPQYGYKTQVIMDMEGGYVSNGAWHWFDNGNGETIYDNRIFICNLILNPSQQKELQDFFSTDGQGRNGEFQMTVPKGIYPFGPDLGDRRRFIVNMIDYDFGGAVENPWANFNNTMKFVLVKAPPYNIPDHISKVKNLKIGAIDNLRHPPGWYSPKTTYGTNTIVTRGTRRPIDAFPFIENVNPAHVLDKSDNADHHESEFVCVEQEKNSAALIYHVQNIIRSSTFTLIAQKNSFVFGRDYSNWQEFRDVGAGQYTCVLIDNVIQISHDSFNRWSTRLAVSKRTFTPLD